VSGEIAKSGVWERPIVEDMLDTLRGLETTTTANDIDLLDIGGNIGWFSFALAQHGYRAVAFEPFRQNRNLMKLTACLNPGVAPRVTVYRHGLGESADDCDLMSWVGHNHGNGVTRCGSQRSGSGDARFKLVDSITVRRFDTLMAADPRRVNLLKIDTEGFELFALRGAEAMFQSAARRPHVLYTEFAPYMLSSHACDPVAYVAFMKQHGLECDGTRGIDESNYAAYVAGVIAKGGEVDLRCARIQN
jgi:FkbM family methyltransferase